MEREIGRSEHGVADGCAAVFHNSEPGLNAMVSEVFRVDRGDVVPGGVRQDGAAGEDAGEGFEEGRGADKGESFGIFKAAGPECDGINSGHGERGPQGLEKAVIH